MTENTANQPRTVLTYGLILGLSLIGISLLFYLIHIDLKSKLPTYISYLVLLICLIFGIKARRDQNLGGFISYGKALGTGVQISFIGSILAAIYVLIFFSVIDPEMIGRILEMSEAELMEKGMSDDQIATAMEWTRKFVTPVWMFLFTILAYVFFGFIFSLVVSLFIRREENPFHSN
jgi:hypothetical protein